jgi:hypothetical protein
MPVIRGGHGNDIGGLAIEQAAIVADELRRGIALGGEFARALGQHFRIDIDEVADLDIGQFRERAHVRLAAAVDPDHRDPQAVVRANDPRIAPRRDRHAQRRARALHHCSPVQHRSSSVHSSRSLIERNSTRSP